MTTTAMQKLIPYIPLRHSAAEAISGPAAAQHLDAGVFEASPQLVAFCRPMIPLEFSDAPQALRAVLGTPPLDPFRVVVEVRRHGGLFETERQVLQVQMTPGFDPSLVGTLRAGFLTNTSTDRPAEPISKGEASRLFYARPSK